MTRLVAVTLLGMAVGVVPTASYAQAPPAPPQTLDLSTAKKMVAAAEAAAIAKNLKVAICVLDSNGDVVLAERMDGKSHNAVSTSQGKARAALIFGVPTSQIGHAIEDKKPFSASLTNLPVGAGGETTLTQGGVPVMKDGKIVGAIGVGGSPGEDDEKLAHAGADAAAIK